MKHMDILQRMPFMAQDAVFRRLSEIAEVASLSKEERWQYDESLKHYRDTIAVMHGQYLEGMEEGMEKGMKKGMEKGLEKGLEKGRAEGMLEVARKMKEARVPYEQIALYTGVGMSEIEGL